MSDWHPSSCLSVDGLTSHGVTIDRAAEHPRKVAGLTTVVCQSINLHRTGELRIDWLELQPSRSNSRRAVMSSEVLGSANASPVETPAVISYPQFVGTAVERLGQYFGEHLRGA